MTTLLLGPENRAAAWREVFAAANEPLITGSENVERPEDIRYLVCWKPDVSLDTFPNLEVVISTGAGVDHLIPMPDHLRLCRTLSQDIEEKVRDWVVMACLMLCRDMPIYLDQARRGLWNTLPVPSSRNRNIGIMGMGRIGRLAAVSLRELGFSMFGWSRSGTSEYGVEMYGADALPAFLEQSDVLVCLLPLTDSTRGILGQELFGQLPEGAMLVHAGRGSQLRMDDLRAALETGQISSAMIDVTDPEPLPEDHWAWTHPKLIVTPHAAASTDYRPGAEHALRVIRSHRVCAASLPGEIDLSRGY